MSALVTNTHLGLDQVERGSGGEQGSQTWRGGRRGEDQREDRTAADPGRAGGEARSSTGPCHFAVGKGCQASHLTIPPSIPYPVSYPIARLRPYPEPLGACGRQFTPFIHQWIYLFHSLIRPPVHLPTHWCIIRVHPLIRASAYKESGLSDSIYRKLQNRPD